MKRVRERENLRPGPRPALRLAALLGSTGALHLVVPKPYDAMVPPALPGKARTYTCVSGVAEIAVAGALVIPRTRRIGGLAAAALFVAVFPANVQMAVDWWRDPKTPMYKKVGALLRLPFQIPLISQALKVRGNAAARA